MKMYFIILWAKMFFILKKISFNYKQRIALYDKIYRLCSNEINLGYNEVIIELRDQELKYSKRKTLIYYVYEDIASQLARGSNESESLKQYVPPVDSMMIQSFAQDDISTGFKGLIEYNERTREMNSALIKALAYPSFLFAFILGIVYYFSTSLIPSLTTAIPPDAELSGTSEMMIFMSNNYSSFLTTIILSLVSIVALLAYLLPNYNGRFRKNLENIPPFSIYRIVNGCGFLNALSALSKAGFQQHQAIEEMMTTATPYLKYRLELISEQIKNSDNLGSALVNINLNFPDKKMLKEIELVSRFGVLEDSLDKYSEQMTESGLKIINGQAAVLKNFATAMVAFTIMFLFSGIYSLSQDMGDAAEKTSKM